MALTILNGHEEKDRQQWIDLLATWPEREVFADPHYVSLFAEPDESVLGLWYPATEGGILWPVIRRPLSKLEWAGGAELFDLTNAYGYGGPYAWGSGPSVGPHFWRAVANWASAQGVVCSFSRLSVFPEQLSLPSQGVDQVGWNVVRSVDLDPEVLWMDFAHKVRKNVNRAKRDGVTVTEDPTGQHIEEFLRIYYQTMDRREAGKAYYFPAEFFQTLVTELKGQYCFFHSWKDDRIVSTELVLVSRHNVYSFLGGTDSSAFSHRPNDALKYAVMQWAHKKGKRAFVLGGGYTGKDGIFRYKLSFAPKGQVPFYVLRLIHDQPLYDELIGRRARWEKENTKSWQPRDGFFPAYRS